MSSHCGIGSYGPSFVIRGVHKYIHWHLTVEYRAIKSLLSYYGRFWKNFQQISLIRCRIILLSVLDFSNNFIMRALRPFVFSKLTRTRLLDISGNLIETIEPEFFENMHDIRVLNLTTRNCIKTNKHQYHRSWKIGLTELDLSGNHVESN